MDVWPMLWSDVMLVSDFSVIEVVYCLVIYIVGPQFHEVGWWPRPNQDVSLEEASCLDDGKFELIHVIIEG
jgi:hypothetical protein